MIYLDSSALITAVVRRTHADALNRYLADKLDETATSTVGFIETVRTCDLYGTFPGLMSQLLSEHGEIVPDAQVREDAAHLPGKLRSLDAIHVASAALFGPELIALVTYDQRMADAARGAGLPVAMPGLS